MEKLKIVLTLGVILNPSCSPNATVFHWFTCSDCGVFRTQTKSFFNTNLMNYKL